MTYHKRIVALLLDGTPRTFREIYRAVARHIDPVTADREYRRRHPSWRTTERDTRIKLGKKRLVFLSLNGMHHHRDMLKILGGTDWDRVYQMTRKTIKRLQDKTLVPA